MLRYDAKLGDFRMWGANANLNGRREQGWWYINVGAAEGSEGRKAEGRLDFVGWIAVLGGGSGIPAAD